MWGCYKIYNLDFIVALNKWKGRYMRDIAVKKKKADTVKFNRRNLPLVLMMIPGLGYLLINNYIPMFGVIVAFKNFKYSKGILGSEWNGLSNFEFLIHSPDFFVITRNTILYNLAFLFINTIVAIAFAIFFDQLRSKLALKLYQTIMLLPYMISMVIVSYICYAFLSPESGFINKSILEPLGFKSISWYADAGKWIFILPIVNFWKNVGYLVIIYFTSVIGVDKTYYEAARIDGASRWQEISRITLPLIRPTIITMSILAIGRIFNSDFGLFYQVPMNSGVIYKTTDVITTFVYRALLQQGDIGMSSAAGLYQAIVGFILVLVTNQIVRKLDNDNSMF